MVIVDDHRYPAYKEWCEKTLGPVADLHCGWAAGWESIPVNSPHMNHMYVHVIRFVREIDLVAFKLKFEL